MSGSLMPLSKLAAMDGADIPRKPISTSGKEASPASDVGPFKFCQSPFEAKEDWGPGY